MNLHSEQLKRLHKAVATHMNLDRHDDEFQGYMHDVANHGANAGFSGFIYYTDTCAFYQANRNDIIAMARDMMTGLDEQSLSTFIARFNCLNVEPYEVEDYLMGEADDNIATMIENALAWFALEEVAHAVVEN